MKKTKKGFTLIELVVVILVLAIIAAIAIPTIIGSIKKAERTAIKSTMFTMASAINTKLSLIEDTNDFKGRVYIPAGVPTTGVYKQVEDLVLESIDRKLDGKYLIIVDYGNANSKYRFEIIICYREEGYAPKEKGYIYENGEITYGNIFYEPPSTQEPF